MAMPPVQVWESLLQYHVYYIAICIFFWDYFTVFQCAGSFDNVQKHGKSKDCFLFFFSSLTISSYMLNCRFCTWGSQLTFCFCETGAAICCRRSGAREYAKHLLEAREARETIEILGGSKSTPSHVKKSCQTSKNSRAVPISSCSLWKFMFMVPQRNEELQKKWANIN